MAGTTYTRRAALLVWTALLVLALAFLGVVLAAGGQEHTSPGVRDALFWIVTAASALDIALVRVLAPRIGGEVSTDPQAVAFTRLLFAWAVSEAAVIFPLVAYLITDDARLVGVFAVDLLALALLYPSDQRWESVTPVPARGAAAVRRMVR